MSTAELEAFLGPAAGASHPSWCTEEVPLLPLEHPRPIDDVRIDSVCWFTGEGSAGASALLERIGAR